MQGGEKLSLDQIRALLEASLEIRFSGHSRKEVFEWVGQILREHDYSKQGRETKWLVRAYVGKFRSGGEVKETAYGRHRFTVHYTRADAEQLAKVDEAHDTMAGPATRKILAREFTEIR